MLSIIGIHGNKKNILLTDFYKNHFNDITFGDRLMDSEYSGTYFYKYLFLFQ